jgi:hypothetical protein
MIKRLLIALLVGVAVVGCTPPSAAALTPVAEEEPSAANLSGLKDYASSQASALQANIGKLQAASDAYYALAEEAGFDYAALWESKPDDVLKALNDARAAFLAANPEYERMEGIVAGVPSLSEYDVILDAGTSGADSPEDAVPFDLTLPDGRVLEKPGNLFEVTEATLWGTDPNYIIDGINPDFNGNGAVDLGDTLPDANVLKGAADAFVKYTDDLAASIAAWEPTEAEAFGALVGNVPTFTDFMEAWKNSSFVMGDKATGRGFVATSRLSDLSDNILSWQTIYAGLSPAVKTVAPDQDAQITKDLNDLQAYVSDIYAQEKGGKQFTPEEADTLNAEGQKRATAIAGQIAQVAALLGITLETE